MDKSRRHETDFYISYCEDIIAKKETIITFKFPTVSTFTRVNNDWYIAVALEKADKVKVDRHLLTRELLLSYRWAIREGYQHMLDPALKNQFDYPRNQNTINGIKGYVERIKKLSEAEYPSND